jgi:hypothetical protein
VVHSCFKESEAPRHIERGRKEILLKAITVASFCFQVAAATVIETDHDHGGEREVQSYSTVPDQSDHVLSVLKDLH